MYTSNLGYVPAAFKDKAAVQKWLDDNMPRGTKYAGIIHDKDVYTSADEATDASHKAGTPKTPHVHFSFYLPSAKTPSAFAKILNVPPQVVQIFHGENAKQNLFAYLVHLTEGSKEDGKHVYDYDEVITNFDYKAYVEGTKHSIESARLEKAEVQEMVLNGSLRYIDFVMNDDYTTFYLQNKTFVTTLIDTVYKRRMNDHQREPIDVLYICGGTGSGKTAFAKQYALEHYRDYCVSSSHNDSTQDYLGQDVMIFDDARPGDFTASEWLKLLDPYNNESTINSRYYNKYLAVKCIILTTVTPFEDFFVYAPKKESSDLSEPVGQFMRRFTAVLRAERREQADIIYTDVSIHEIVPLDKPVSRRVGDTFVDYLHEVSPKPAKVVSRVIGRKHSSGFQSLLGKF